ncbi:MAG: tetratricopeptide repeat protein [Pyrinomonadaceae bacterium]
MASLLVPGALTATAQVRPPGVPSTPSSEITSAGSIRGKVVLPNGALMTQGTRIVLQTMRGVEASVFTNNEGQFEFTKLRPGSYQLVIEGENQQFETTTENVEVVRALPVVLTIVLKSRTESTRKKATAISAAELGSDIPAKAKKEFELGSSASKGGKYEDAIAHLRKAIAIYPGYVMARNDLGAQLLGQGKLDDAEEELRRAIELDSKAFNPHLNLGIVLVHQQKFSEAAEILKQALSLEPGSASARLYSGMALVGLDDFFGAERELKTAHDLGGPAYAMALFQLGQIYLNRGDNKQAVRMFETYLQESPNAANAVEVKKLLAMLQ